MVRKKFADCNTANEPANWPIWRCSSNLSFDCYKADRFTKMLDSSSINKLFYSDWPV